MDTHRSKKISKLYRKMITSEKTKAFLIYKGLDEKTKEELQMFMKDINSPHYEKLVDKNNLII
jgi:hypothetical protein